MSEPKLAAKEAAKTLWDYVKDCTEDQWMEYCASRIQRAVDVETTVVRAGLETAMRCGISQRWINTELKRQLADLQELASRINHGSPLKKKEYGAGAYIDDSHGNMIADFSCHLDAENFIDLVNSLVSADVGDGSDE